MDSIKNIVIVLCFTLVIFGMASTIVTDKKMGKPIKSILGILFTAVIISTIRGNSAVDLSQHNFNFEEIKTDNLNKIVEERYIMVAEESTENYIKEKLTEKGIKVLYISISMDISKDNSIFISEATVHIEGDSNLNTAKTILKDNLGIDAVVQNES